MRISQLAERAGVPASTLRFYEGAGLLPAERSAAGYRLYGPRALERLGFIGTAKRLGLTLEEIAELLGVWEGGACREVKAELRPRIAARLAQAEKHRAETEVFIGELNRALKHLDTLPDRAEPCDPECAFPETNAPVLPVERWRSAPVACSLGGEEPGARTTQWRQVLEGGRRRAIPEGWRVSLPVERAGRLAELCAAEHECCAFFDFVLHLDGPLVHVDVRAPAQAADLLDQLLGVRADAASPGGARS